MKTVEQRLEQCRKVNDALKLDRASLMIDNLDLKAALKKALGNEEMQAKVIQSLLMQNEEMQRKLLQQTEANADLERRLNAAITVGKIMAGGS